MSYFPSTGKNPQSILARLLFSAAALFALTALFVPAASAQTQYKQNPPGCFDSTSKQLLYCVCDEAECKDRCTKASKTCFLQTTTKCTVNERKCPITTTSTASPSGTAADAFKGVNLINPIGGSKTNPKGVTDIPTIIGRVISIITGVVGALALLMFVYGSFVLMTSRGVSDKVTSGKKIMIQAVIGLAVIFTAYAVIQLIFTTLGA